MHSWHGMVQPEKLLEVSELFMSLLCTYACKDGILYPPFQKPKQAHPQMTLKTLSKGEKDKVYHYDTDLAFFGSRICYRSWTATPQVIISVSLISALEKLLGCQFLSFNVCQVFQFPSILVVVFNFPIMLLLMLQQK